MRDHYKTKEELIAELKEMRQKVSDLEIIKVEHDKTEKALEFERNRLFSVLEAIPVWVYLQAPDYSIRWGNSKFLELFGDPKGRPCYEALQGRNAPCIPCPTFRVFETKTLQKWEYNGADGQTSIIYDNYFLDSDGSPLVLEMGINVTELKEKERKIRELNETLELRVKERTAELALANAEILSLNQELKEENLRMSAELDIVRRLQEMVLPRSEELDHIKGLDIVGFMEPADEVGGDYYDILRYNGRIKIGIGDVTGHGLESGVLMLMTQTAVRTLLLAGETDPVRFLSVLNRLIYDNVQRMKIDKTLSLSILDYTPPVYPDGKRGNLKLSGQHEEMILVRKGGKTELVDTVDLGFPIGLEENISGFVAEKNMSLEAGDGVVLYSDGFTEAENMNGEFYGIEKLCNVISRNWEKSAEEIKKEVVDDVRLHIGEQKMYDDLTLVVLKQL